jgi:hypothetical protein
MRIGIHLFLLISCSALWVCTVSKASPPSINPTITKSEGVNVSSNISKNSEIERLTGEVTQRRRKSEFWDTWNLRLLWVAGFIAVSLAVTSVGVSRSNRKLLEASDELEKAKDRALQDDLKSRDEKIAALNDHAAALQVEALNLQKQLLAQGPREKLLNGENRRELIDTLKNFAGQKVDVRRSAFVMMANSKLVSSTPVGDDTIGLANSLYGILKDAAWVLPPNPLVSGVQGHGIQIEVVQGATSETIAAARALVATLRKTGLEVNNPLLSTPEQAGRVSVDPILPDFGKDTIVLTVLPHQ